ncbi:MAG: nicotinate phosphoribosyltransferase [Acidobacteriota bacterium]|nr:nicotinate phosphoribosyltransferase [Acidobacteriota bacterium]
MGRALCTDFYELNMAASYLRRGMTAPATFSLFVRRLPPRRGFLVAAGIEDCVEWLEGFGFDEGDLGYLAGLGFEERDLEALAGLRFTGELWAIPEGRVVFAGEPLLELTAPLPEAQLAETFLLNQVTFQTALASKAARCRLAAGEAMELVEFGFRRTHGVDAAMAAARGAAIAGFAGTSNVEAARRFGLRASGTMAHSYVESFPSELDAFRAFASDLPERAIFLVDTYDTATGVRRAVRVIGELGLGRRAGIRIDSGDLVAVSREARALLDQAGLTEVRIFVSGGLDEGDLAALVTAGAPVDAAGVGTRLGVSADAPYLDSVYKLVAYDGRPVMKLSTGKETAPGAKQVFRRPGLDDCIGLRQEEVPPGAEALLSPVMTGGRRLAAPPTAAQAVRSARDRFVRDVAELPSAAGRLEDPEAPAPARSAALEDLTAEVRARHQQAGGD